MARSVASVAAIVGSQPSDAAGSLSPPGTAGGAIPRPAKRQRYAQVDPLDIAVQPMLCLVGQRLKHPVCLPTQSIEGETLVRWAQKEPWINQVVAGRVDCPKLDAACGRVKASIVKAVRSGARQDESDMLAAAQAGRMDLGLDEDSDLDETHQGGQPGGCQPEGGCVSRKGAVVCSPPTLRCLLWMWLASQ